MINASTYNADSGADIDKPEGNKAAEFRYKALPEFSESEKLGMPDEQLLNEEPGISEKAVEGRVEEKQSAKSPAFGKVLQSLKTFASFGTLLRLVGSASMVVALVLYLFDGFHLTADHLTRFWILLGFSAITTVSGVAVSRFFKDQKGARSLVSVALISVPACFAVLGALVYSLFPVDGLNDSYPGYLLWQAADLTQLCIAAAVCLAVAGAVTFFCFSVLARQIRVQLFVSMLLGSLLLLVPVRESLMAVVVAGIAVLLCVSILYFYVRPVLSVKTGWANLAMAVTALPAVIVVGRTVLLYGLSDLLMLGMAVAAHVVLVFVARSFSTETSTQVSTKVTQKVPGKARLIAEAGLILTVISILYHLFVFLGHIDPSLHYIIRNHETWIMMFALSALYVHLDWFVSSTMVRRVCRILTSMSWLLMFMVGTLIFPLPILPLMLIVVMIAAFTAFGIFKGYKSVITAGAVAGILFLVRYYDGLMGLAYDVGILGVVAFGVFCVITAHLLEKHGPLVKAKIVARKKSEKDALSAEFASRNMGESALQPAVNLQAIQG